MSSKARFQNLSQECERAAAQNNWGLVQQNAERLIGLDARKPDGYYYQARFQLANRALDKAIASLKKCVFKDKSFKDGAILLSELLIAKMDFNEAFENLQALDKQASSDFQTLMRKGQAYGRMGLHQTSWEVFNEASRAGTSSDLLRSNLAASAVMVGELDVARTIYSELLKAYPDHQRYHYELSKIGGKPVETHIDQMRSALGRASADDSKNIFLYFALGKAYEDIGEWGEAFKHFAKGNAAAWDVSHAAGYRVEQDIAVLDFIREKFTRDWFQASERDASQIKTPIFIVGLPRSGTTLTERILLEHEGVQSVDETFFLESHYCASVGLARSRMPTIEPHARLTPEHCSNLIRSYLKSIDFRLDGSPYVVEKYPPNFQFLQAISQSRIESKILYLTRNPMDQCFALFKQPHFQYALRLEDMARYFAAYKRLEDHWRDTLSDELTFINYDQLVNKPEETLRPAFENLGISFDPRSLNFYKSKGPSASASNAQIRQSINTRSVDKWMNWKEELSPLSDILGAEGLL